MLLSWQLRTSSASSVKPGVYTLKLHSSLGGLELRGLSLKFSRVCVILGYYVCKMGTQLS